MTNRQTPGKLEFCHFQYTSINTGLSNIERGAQESLSTSFSTTRHITLPPVTAPLMAEPARVFVRAMECTLSPLSGGT